ncbi:pyruvate dehydrogenase complex dihydrolipoamide acetyltransferase [Alphaproteobacteria bacterium]|nr:pyruvate dehydrogenase complex dihydrolipoamide acetyltransferase [Alphaproteobacteria bacterium]
MSVNVTMPALSPTMTEGTVAKWLIDVGETVHSGDVIAEIETDKATMEVESIEDGVVAHILVEAGSENVAVGTVIAILAEAGEAVDAISATPVTAVADEAPAAPTETPANTPAEIPAETPALVKETTAAPPTGTAQTGVAQKSMAETSKRIFATPLARRIAANKGIALDGLTGSGPHGRILRRDVEAAPAAPAVQITPASANAMSSSAAAGASELVANSQMRQVIASRLQQSKQQAPHFYVTVDCQIDTLLAARRALNEKAPDGVKISLNDLVIRATAMALMAVPDANVAYEDTHTRRFQHADICMAVAIDGGLVTPVIWAAETMGLAALSQTTADLASRARQGQLRAAEYTGGSFTISNLGMFGVREFAAVINPPQGAILAVGAGEQRPVVVDGALAVATVMTVTLSADHRAVDGAVAAQWLQSFKGFVENPVTMLL